MTDSPLSQRRRARGRAVWVGLLVLATPALVQAQILVDLVQIGIPTRDARQGAVRPGAWTPIVVDVSIPGDQSSFDGTLRAVQRDGDGDQIVDKVEVHLLASSGGSQRYWLYTLAGGGGADEDFGIELLDENGEIVEVVSGGELTLRVVPEQPPLFLFDGRDQNNAIVLAISVASGGRVLDLAEGQGLFDLSFRVGHIAPGTVPDLWIGLDAVDYVVWDEADPADMSGRQLDALMEWVRQGGTLLLAASGTAGAVAGHAELAAMMPVDIGEVVRMTEPGLIARVLFGNRQPVEYSGTMATARCSARPGAFVYYRDNELKTDLVTRIRAGRGHVIYCGASLVDLFTKFAPRVEDPSDDVDDLNRRRPRRQRTVVDDNSAREFYRRVLGLKYFSNSDDRPDRENVQFVPQIQGPVQFPEDAGLYLLITIGFMAIYGVVATVGSWTFLQRRGWQRHNWTAFTVIAMFAGFLSISTVEAVQGFGITVRQVSVVDADAGERFGHASAFFGIKTASHVDLDVWLPSDPIADREPTLSRCFLRPVFGEDRAETVASQYTDPGSYELRPGSAELAGVPFRATMKALEGRWEGPLGGRVSARVGFTSGGTGGGNDVRFTSDSFITNELGVDLKKCYLLYAITPLYDKRVGETSSPAGRSQYYVLALPLQDIKAAETVLLASRFDPDAKFPNDRAEAAKFVDSYTLEQEQKRWLNARAMLVGKNRPAGEIDMRLSRQQCALLLASTSGDLDAELHPTTALSAYGNTGSGLRRGRLRHLDLRDQLWSDVAVLVGFAESDAGPVRLATRRGARDYRVAQPDADASLTMYRIRIPVSGGSTVVPAAAGEAEP